MDADRSLRASRGCGRCRDVVFLPRHPGRATTVERLRGAFLPEEVDGPAPERVDPVAAAGHQRGVDREQPLARAGWAEQSSLDLAGQLLDQERTPASAVIQEELQKRLHEAIAQLDEDDREMILMRHFEQLANQEVAAALGLTEAAASMKKSSG